MKLHSTFFRLLLFTLVLLSDRLYSQFELTTVTELATLRPAAIVTDPDGQTLLMKDDTIYTYGTSVTDKFYCGDCNSILDIAFYNGDMFIANESGGIVKRTGDDTEVVTSLRATRLVADKIGNIYGVHFLDGLVFSDGQDWIELNTSNSDIPTNDIYDLAIDSSGILWMATQIGLISWNWLSFSVKPVPDELSETFYDIEIDADDNIWVTSAFGGVGKYDHANWTTYPDDFSFLTSVQNLAIVNGREIWTSESGEGLYRYNGTDFDLVTYQELGVTEWNINRVLSGDSHGRLWIHNDFTDLKYLTTDPSSVLPVRGYPASVTIYPNPSNGEIKLALENVFTGSSYTIQVYSPEGKRILNEQRNSSDALQAIQLQNQPAGIYQVVVLLDGKTKYTGRVSLIKV
jgi:hypothetical protein